MVSLFADSSPWWGQPTSAMAIAVERLGVHEAPSFDSDYVIYRFGRDHRQALTAHT